MKHRTRSRALAAFSLAAVLSVGAWPVVNQAHAARPHATPVKVGFLFSDFTTSDRWAFDRDYFKAQLKKLDPNVQVIVEDAKVDQTRQNNQAKSLLTAGAKVLVDVPEDSTQAKAIVFAAHQNKPSVPVIAYDRLIFSSPVDAYASFNGFQVGVVQAKFLKARVKKGGTIVSIAGATTDNNAHLFYNGAMSVLRPLFKSGYYKLGYDKFTPSWSATAAQAEMASALNANQNKVNGVLVANDGMAAGVITALKAQGLAGKVPVTGQDATAAGIQQILLGNQTMTVYKPYIKLATRTANIVHGFLHGQKFHSALTTPNAFRKVPSAIIPVIAVTKSNVRETVIKDKYLTKALLCKGIPASACKFG